MDEITTELRRIARRWRELPDAVASRHAPLVRELTQQLADAAAPALGREPLAVPDLGAAALLDQLAVMVYDADRAGLHDDALRGLTRLRRALP